MNKQGMLYVVAAPSGCGKTSLVHALVSSEDNIQISISHTTRPARPGEKTGVEYHFVDDAEFQKLVDEKAFLEYANVFGHSYGTSRQWIADTLEKGTDVILEIDWQGARQVGQLFHHVKSIFIVPPSLETLRSRLEARQQDSQEVIDGRMEKAIEEMSHFKEFTYLLVNDVFEETVEKLRAIMAAERLKCRYQEDNLAPLLAKLLKKG